MCNIKIPPHYRDWALLVLRLAVGVIFIYHGQQKWGLWNAEPSAMMSAGQIYLMRFLSVVEPLGGLGLILGSLTQWAALGLALIMLGAIYTKMFVWQIGFAGTAGWEFDLILLAANLVLLAMGAGALSVDAKCESKSPPQP